MAKTTASYKSRVLKYLEAMKVRVLNPDKKDTTGALLGEIFTWQEIETLARMKKEVAWAKAQDLGGIVPSDEELRKTIQGEVILVESTHFSCIVKTLEQRESFDRDLFIKRLAKKYKVPTSTLVKIAERCKKLSCVPVSKRIVEA